MGRRNGDPAAAKKRRIIRHREDFGGIDWNLKKRPKGRRVPFRTWYIIHYHFYNSAYKFIGSICFLEPMESVSHSTVVFPSFTILYPVLRTRFKLLTWHSANPRKVQLCPTQHRTGYLHDTYSCPTSFSGSRPRGWVQNSVPQSGGVTCNGNDFRRQVQR